MKKALLSIIAVGACIASGYAQKAEEAVYGTTPETAKPMPVGGWFVENLETVPAEVYFTYTNTQASPVLWGDVPVPSEKQVWAYLCNGGQEAFQMTEGSDSYIILPGQEVLVKIAPKNAGFYCFNAAMPLPDSMMGKRKYYPIVTTSADWSTSKSVAPGETAWYQLEVPYPTQIVVKDPKTFQPSFAFESVEAIHIECPGGTNIGDVIAGPYVKAGKNVVGVTAPATATENVNFMFSYNAMVTLNCGNNLMRGKSLELDAKNTYPDAYYTVDRFFKVPEDGTYTFTNHGAVGTILNVGMVKLTDPNDQYKYECDWSEIKTATVGNEDAVIVVDDLKAGDIVLVQSDAFGVIGKGMEDQPYLMVQKGDASGVEGVAVEGDVLNVVAANGRLSVESVLLASGAEVAVYDMQAKKVASAVAAEGASSIEMALDVTPGVYVVVVYGKGNSESAKFVVK